MNKVYLLCLLMLAPLSRAEVIDNLTYTYYTVDAKSGGSLSHLLDAASPIRENGRIFHGNTRWNVTWNVRWHENPGGRCYLTSTTVRLVATIQLPKLVDADAAQRAQFDRYFFALRTHELGHYEIGKDAAMVIDRNLHSLGEMQNCHILVSASNDLAQKTLVEFKKKEAQYDLTTDHGKTQGARLTQDSGGAIRDMLTRFVDFMRGS